MVVSFKTNSDITLENHDFSKRQWRKIVRHSAHKMMIMFCGLKFQQILWSWFVSLPKANWKSGTDDNYT